VVGKPEVATGAVVELEVVEDPGCVVTGGVVTGGLAVLDDEVDVELGVSSLPLSTPVASLLCLEDEVVALFLLVRLPLISRSLRTVRSRPLLLLLEGQNDRRSDFSRGAFSCLLVVSSDLVDFCSLAGVLVEAGTVVLRPSGIRTIVPVLFSPRGVAAFEEAGLDP
jgi:hypothetical protein